MIIREAPHDLPPVSRKQRFGEVRGARHLPQASLEWKSGAR